MIMRESSFGGKTKSIFFRLTSDLQDSFKKVCIDFL